MKKLLLYVLALVGILSYSLPVRADELSDAKSKQRDINNTLSSIAQSKTQQKTKLKDAVSAKEQLIAAQKQKDKEYGELQQLLKELNDDLGDIDEQLAQAEKNYEHQQELFKMRLKAMYEYSDTTFLEMLVESKDLNDLMDRMEIMSRIAKQDRQLEADLLAAKKDVDFKRGLKEQEIQNKQKQAAAKKQKIEEIKASRADIEEQIDSISIKLDQLEKQEDEMVRQSNALNDLIKKLMRRPGKFSGKLEWPTPSCYTISSEYGNRYHPILHKYKLHTGVDIAAKSGASILAAADGTVILASWYGSYGNCVIIDHGGGIATLYGHMSRILVSEGANVKRGGIIGKVGSTGLSTGPHLHFEVRVNGATTNPMNYFKSN